MKYLNLLFLLSVITLSACGFGGGNSGSVHSVCVQESCVEVSGKGINECALNSDCEEIIIPEGNTIFGFNGPHSQDDLLEQSFTYYEDLGINKIRIWEDWGYREISKDDYKWNSLDSRIKLATDNGYSIFLTLKPVGTHSDEIMWYCEEDTTNLNSCVFTEEGEIEFKEYIELLTTRYSGKIDKIAFSNEWDSDYHFTGSAEDYVKYANWVYEITKKNSPSTKVVIGAMTKNPFRYAAICEYDLLTEGYDNNGRKATSEQLKQFCALQENKDKWQRTKYVLENAKYDYLDIHLYDDPEYWAEYLEAMKRLSNKPWLSSEFGGPRDTDMRYDAYDENFQAEELKRYMETLVELNFEEVYYFTLVAKDGVGIGHPLSGILKYENGEVVKKPGYDVFKQTKIDLET